MPIKQNQARIKQDAHSFQTYNFSTILQNPIFVIDSHFEEYYTHSYRGNANMRLFHGNSQVR